MDALEKNFLRLFQSLLKSIDDSKGEKGEKGDTIVGPPGPKGDPGIPGADGQDGKNGKNGKNADLSQVEKISESILESHEQKFNHHQLHDQAMVGTKKIDETDIEDKKIIQYDGKRNRLVYARFPIIQVQEPAYGRIARSTNPTMSVISKTSTYILTNSDDVIECDASSAAWTLSLLAVGSATKKRYTFTKTDSSDNAITVDPSGSETMSGLTTYQLVTQWDTLTIIPNTGKTSWLIL